MFRVNYRTGEMSICYVFDEKVVCTPQTNPSTASTTAVGPAAPQPGPAPSVRPAAGVSPQRP